MNNNFSVTVNPYLNMKKEDICHHIFAAHQLGDAYNELGQYHLKLLLEGYAKRTNNKLSSVIDYGCGDGRVAQYMAKECNELACIDISSVVLEATRERIKDKNVLFLLNTEVVIIPYADFIYSLQVVQHNPFAEQIKILQNIKELLKDNGIACIHFPKIEDKPLYRNTDTCMCFTKEQVSNYGTIFSSYEIEEVNFIDGWIDYYLWVNK